MEKHLIVIVGSILLPSLGMVFYYFHYRLNTHSKEIGKMSAELNDFKTHIVDNYAKRDEVSTSLRLLKEDIKDMLKEIKEDIHDLKVEVRRVRDDKN